MKRKIVSIYKTSVSVFTCLVICSSGYGEINEDYMVYQNDGYFIVKGQVSNAILQEFDDSYEAIQYAINLLKDTGGQVLLNKGEYYLKKPLILRNNIELTGKGRATNLIVNEINLEGIAIIGKQVHGLEISNLKITSQGKDTVAGILIEGSGNSNIIDVLVVNFGQYGIWIRNESFLCHISRCSLAGNKRANIFFDTQREGLYGNYIPNMISDCIIYGGGKGIDCYKTTVLNIVGCIIYQTNDVAINLDNTTASVLVSSCRTFQITGNALHARQSPELNLTGNIFCWHTGHGIVLEDCGWGTITGNEIIDNGSYNVEAPHLTLYVADYPDTTFSRHDGIRLKNVRGFSITGNTIFNWPGARKFRHGIVEDKTSHHNTITANTINYFLGEAIISKGEGSQVENNMIYNDLPFAGNPGQTKFQSFEKKLTEKFIDLINSN